MTASPASSLILIGIGGAGANAARGIHRAYGGSLRILVGRIEFDGADDTLLGDLKILLAENGEESES